MLGTKTAPFFAVSHSGSVDSQALASKWEPLLVPCLSQGEVRPGTPLVRLWYTLKTLKCFYSACWWSSHRKILTYENLQQPTTTYYSLKIFLAPDLCLMPPR